MKVSDPTHPPRIAAALLLSALCWASPAAAGSAEIIVPDAEIQEGPATAYYRWIDDQGRVQYTDFEPVGIPAQRIPLEPVVPDDAPAISRSGNDRQPDPFHDQDQQILPIEHIGPCADARAQLAVLYAAVPVYRTDTGQYRAAWRGDTYRGERIWLDAEDRTAAIAGARAAVLARCSDPAAFEKEVQAFDSEVGRP